jgi:hypothetical protein
MQKAEVTLHVNFTFLHTTKKVLTDKRGEKVRCIGPRAIAEFLTLQQTTASSDACEITGHVAESSTQVQFWDSV